LDGRLGCWGRLVGWLHAGRLDGRLSAGRLSAVHDASELACVPPIATLDVDIEALPDGVDAQHGPEGDHGEPWPAALELEGAQGLPGLHGFGDLGGFGGVVNVHPFLEAAFSVEKTISGSGSALGSGSTRVILSGVERHRRPSSSMMV